jgi:hypothetical protein
VLICVPCAEHKMHTTQGTGHPTGHRVATKQKIGRTDIL